MTPPSIYDVLSTDHCAASESLSAMIEKEIKVYSCCGYLEEFGHSECGSSTTITAYDRLKMIDWCYTVIDQCNFQRETVAIAMEVADRFLSIQSGTRKGTFLRKKSYQLVAMSALYTAIKMNEQKVVDPGLFSSMSQGVYTAREIEDMEMEILSGLSWRVIAPTSVQMANHILSLVFHKVDVSESTWEHILDDVKFQAEAAVRDYYFTTERSSTIAMAAIVNTFDQIESEIYRNCLYSALLGSISNFNLAPIAELIAAKKRLVHQLTNDDENNSSSPRSSLTEESLKQAVALVVSPRCVTFGF